MKLGYAIPHEIRIRASANMGFIVKIGCGEFVAVNYDLMLHDLREYFNDPDKWERGYNKLPGRSGDEAEALRPEPPRQEPDTNPETTTEAAG